MKKTIVLVLLLVVTVTFALPQPIKDLRDFLWQPPDKIYRDYGYNENTLVLFNIACLVKISKDYEKRIVILEKQLLVTDVNIVDVNN